jgi:hypothetical protein
MSLDEATAAADGPKGPSQRDKLISVADDASLWRCPDGVAHATVPVNGHIEHYRVRSQGFREWLIVEAGRRFPAVVNGKSRPGTFGKNALEDALLACEAMATANAVTKDAPLRVAAHGGNWYLDLGRPSWEAVEITPDGWRVIPKSPTPILRTRRTRPLPIPVKGGSLEMLRGMLPLASDDDWRLDVLWLLAALRPSGPYPILALSGEQGTGKSLKAKMLRRLVDPCGDDIMQPPREDRDLIAAAKGNHVLAFDNLSTMPGELADSLCRLATGGDIGGRLLYTNDESAAFAAQRPIIVNGIPDLVTRGDLASRAIFVRLVPMERRRTEAELQQAFDAAAPGILGALLDVLSQTLAALPTTRLPEDSAAFRMADFALLAAAAESALGWPEGSALNAIRNNMRGATAMLADLDPVAAAIRGMVEQNSEFRGTISALFAKLNGSIDPDIKRAPGWPKHPARLGEHLRRIAPALRSIGIDCKESRTRNERIVVIGARDSDGLSLSLQSEEERESDGDGEINSRGFSPAAPAAVPRNPANPPFSKGNLAAGAAGAAGDTVTRQHVESQNLSVLAAGAAGDEATEFIPPPVDEDERDPLAWSYTS